MVVYSSEDLAAAGGGRYAAGARGAEPRNRLQVRYCNCGTSDRLRQTHYTCQRHADAGERARSRGCREAIHIRQFDGVPLQKALQLFEEYRAKAAGCLEQGFIQQLAIADEGQATVLGGGVDRQDQRHYWLSPNARSTAYTLPLAFIP